MAKRIPELSDIVTFHNYGPLAGVKAEIARLKQTHSRPVICTEWMARGMGSRFASHLPVFKKEKVGCYNWGLVAGRTQTYFPWGSKKGSPEPKLWHHDIFRLDGTPYDAGEIETIRRVLSGKEPTIIVIVPTSESAACRWRYTTDKPADGWQKGDFDDSAWKEGPAPFGTKEPQHGRVPNTDWRTPEIYLRRTVDLGEAKFVRPAFRVHHDEDVEIYLNGVLAARAEGYVAEYVELPLTAEGKAALKPGKNVLAVRCRQTVGGQYIDVGVVDVRE